MSNKELIKQEIERLYSEAKQKTYNGEVEGEMCAYDKIISFIDSIPKEHNEDLEEAAKSKYKLITTPPMPAEYAAYYNSAQVSRQEAFKAGAWRG